MFTDNNKGQSLAIQTELEFIAVFAGTSEAALDVREIISPEDFYSPAMGNCYRHLMNLHNMNGGFIAEDMLNYVRESGGDEALNAVKVAVMGVITYSTQGAVSRARKIKQHSIWRQACKAAQDITYTTPETIEGVLETSLQALSGIAMENNAETMHPIQDMLVDFINQKHSNRTENIIPRKIHSGRKPPEYCENALTVWRNGKKLLLTAISTTVKRLEVSAMLLA